MEIPHSGVVNMWMLAPAALPIMIGAGRIYDGAAPLWSSAAMIGLGVLMVAVVRPPQLRATRAGLWFGSRAIIPWQQVQTVYECIPIEGQRHPVRGDLIGIAFHRKRTLLRAPVRLWLPALMFDDIKISLHGTGEVSSAVVTQLETMRMQACGDEGGVLPGAGKLPRARVVARR